ncbi:MAG: desampylase [Herpetosiphon sp.]
MLLLPQARMSMWKHMWSDPEHEICGVLVGERGMSIVDAVAGENVAVDRRTTFLLDARTLLHVDASARHSGLHVVGFYHSHPTSVAFPSSADRAVLWPDAVLLIVAPSQAGATVCGWHRVDGRFEACLLVEPPRSGL